VAQKLLVNNRRTWFQDRTDPAGNSRSQVLADDDKQIGKYFAMTYESPLVASMVSWYTSSHSVGLVDPSYFSIPDGLKFTGHRTRFKSQEYTLMPFGMCPRYGDHSW
jgi:hypothetical protein